MKKLFEEYNIVLEDFSNYKDMLDKILYQCRGKLISLKGQTATEKGVGRFGFRRRTIIKIDDDTEIIIYFYPFLTRRKSFADIANKTLHIGILELISYKGKNYKHYGSKKAWKNQAMLDLKRHQEKDRSVVVVPKLFVDPSFKEFIKNATIKPMSRPKTFDRILAAVAHETTHISQTKNNFMNWDIQRNKKEFDDLSLDIKKSFKNNDRIYYANASHYKSETEHEARLIEYFQHIKRKSYKEAFSLLSKNYLYLSDFKKRKILKNMYDFGLSYKEYKKYTDYIFEILKKEYDNTKQDFYLHHINNIFKPTVVDYLKKYAMLYILKYFKDKYFKNGYDKKYPSITKQLQPGFKKID